MIRNIIFDWSGTLIDDLPAVLAATNHVLVQAGLPAMSREQFRAEFCLPIEKFYRRFTPDTAPAQVEAWFHAKFRDSEHLIVDLPHSRSFLEFCRSKGLRTFLLSTVHRSHYAALSGRNGFGDLLERAYVEVMDKRLKIRELLVENNLNPIETMFVGDMQHDIETAIEGGVCACAVLTGYNTLEQLRASRPDLVVEHLGELQELLVARDFEIGAGSPPAPPAFPISTVGALIYNRRGDVLMIRTQKWSDLWGIPGGKIKYGETALDALRREILEETALTLEKVQFVTVQDCIESSEFYRQCHFLLLNYRARAVKPCEVRLNEEAREFKWVSPDEAARLKLNHPTRVLLGLARAAARSPDCIVIRELCVHYRVGVPDEERVRAQKLLLNLELRFDFSKAAATDSIAETVNYYEVSQRLLRFGDGREWKLIETLASDIADLVLREFAVQSVQVEVRKFILPETRYVAVRIERER